MDNPLAHFVPRCLRELISMPSTQVSGWEAQLAYRLQVPVSELPNIRMGPRYHYRPFTITKRDGRERRILAPSPALKQLQHRLLRNYLSVLPVHPAATAFQRGCSIVDNARWHAGQTLVATLDLVDFFESTTADRVRRFFIQQGWRGGELSALMRLCVYRDGLPQGAPTSPCLSNLVNFDLDEQLTSLAQRANAIYSRYGDDLTFSWRSDRVPAYFEPMLRGVLTDAGYTIHPRKTWRIQHVNAGPQITGLILGSDGKIRVPWHLRWDAFKLRWRLWWHPDPHTAARLQGYENFFSTPGLQ